MQGINQKIKAPFNPTDLMITITGEAKEFKNILFVGDPHFTSRQISSRNDIISTMDSFLKKWEFIAEQSHKYQALTLCLGDLLHSDKEHSILLFNQLSKITENFYFPPFTLVGNHDKTETTLNENNMLYSLIQNHVFFEILDNEITIRTKIDGVNVEVGGTHYGSKIPHKVKRLKNTDKMIWLTHHDLYFDTGYQNMQKLHEINQVDLAVNGHIHLTQKQKQLGMTTWWNTGNITRLSRDVADHIPQIWLWNPIQHNNNEIKLQGIEIPHQKNVFINQKTVEATVQDYLVLSEQKEDERLAFISTAKNYRDSNNTTSDREVLIQSIQALGKKMGLEDKFLNEIIELIE